jgi:peptidoglycan/xylan/chitin deacetylase (PgdA/CDA1 family)
MKVLRSIPILLFLFAAIPARAEELKEQLVAEFGGAEPAAWGENLPGVRTRLATDEPVLALTFDACGVEGDGFDAELIDFLEHEQIPATLFLSGRWLDKNPEAARRLAANPLFDLQNHGTEHRPASVTGREKFGIPGTRDAAALVDEIEINARRIEQLTGRRPRFYRSGTAFYDDVAIRVIERLGVVAVGFSAKGDKGVTRERDKVRDRLLEAPPGAIVLLHMHRPERQTAEGLMDAVPVLRARGFKFVLLRDYPLE